MNILVTGGAGFVGLNLIAALAALPGVRVVAADLAGWDEDARRFLAPVLGQVDAVELDVRDGEAVATLAQRTRITHIVHAAAVTVTAEQEHARAAEIVGVNLLGAVNVLNAALQLDAVERVLLVSSSGVYSRPRPRPRQTVLARRAAETSRLDLTNLYGITKYSAELLAARYRRLTGKPMASVRLSAVYGPQERVRSSRPGLSALYQLRRALQQGRAVRVAGADVARDWTYASDVAAAVRDLLCAPEWRHSVYNVSCGQAVPFAEVVAAFAAHGLEAHWVDDLTRADVAMQPQQARSALDITRLRRDTGFEPQYDIHRGVTAWLESEGSSTSPA